MEKRQLPPDFREFLKLLDAHGVEYLLIGGYAVSYHGYPRSTYDMDLWIGIGRENAEQMSRVMMKFGFGEGEVSPEIFLREDCLIRMGVPPVRLKLLTSISGVEFDACYRNRTIDEFEISPQSDLPIVDDLAVRSSHHRPSPTYRS